MFVTKKSLEHVFFYFLPTITSESYVLSCNWRWITRNKGENTVICTRPSDSCKLLFSTLLLVINRYALQTIGLLVLITHRNPMMDRNTECNEGSDSSNEGNADGKGSGKYNANDENW